MPAPIGRGLVPLALYGRPGPTHVNPSALATLEPWNNRGKSGALLRFVDGSSVRTETPLNDVLAMLAAAL